MKRVIPVFAIAILAVSQFSFGDTYGTVSLELTSALGPAVTAAGESTQAGPYQFQFANPVANGAVLNTPAKVASFNSTFSANTSGTGLAAPINGFCIDLFHNITPGYVYGPTTYYAGPPPQATATPFSVVDMADVPTLANANLRSNILQLISEFQTAGGDPQTPVPGTNSDALTIAIWDALDTNATSNAIGGGASQINGGGMTVSGALLSSDPGALVLANNWLANLNNGITPYNGNIYGLVDAADGGVQSQEIVIATKLDVTTPEPAGTVALAGMCFAGLPFLAIGLVRRRGQQV